MTLPVARFHDWTSRLHAAIESRRFTPFEWGANDCSLFAADLVLAITGSDPAEEWRGKYSDALGAARVLKELGGISGMMDVVSEKYGFRPLPSVAYAQRGDVVETDIKHTGTAGGPALGVCVGAQVAAAGDAGVVFIPLLQCRRAWRVG